MTTNREAWEISYRYYTEDLTKYARRIAFGGFAALGVLQVSDPAVSAPVALALFFLFGFFALDVAQGWLAASRNRRWLEAEEAQRFRESQTIQGDYSERPRNLDEPVRLLWTAKLFVVLTAWGFVVLEWMRKVGTG